MDVQWHFLTEFHLTVVVSKGLSLAQWTFTGIVQRIFSGISQYIRCVHFCDSWRVIFCPELGDALEAVVLRQGILSYSNRL